MSKLLTKFTVLAVLASPLLVPVSAFAQACSPADSSTNQMNRCPPINDGGGNSRNDHRTDQMKPNGIGTNGMHAGKGVSGGTSAHAAGGGGALPSGGAAPGGGMGHGGTAGDAAGGAGGGGAGGAGSGHGK